MVIEMAKRLRFNVDGLRLDILMNCSDMPKQNRQPYDSEQQVR
jgi:hypothetical protein